MRELTLPAPAILCGTGMAVGVIALVVMSRSETVGTVLLVASLFPWMLGTVSWAMAKGQHWAWGLFGTTVIGLLIIALLPDKTRATGKGTLDLSHLDPEVAEQKWTCPKCGVETPNTSYRCERCGYSVI
jgi:hypothetical protein